MATPSTSASRDFFKDAEVVLEETLQNGGLLAAVHLCQAKLNFSLEIAVFVRRPTTTEEQNKILMVPLFLSPKIVS